MDEQELGSPGTKFPPILIGLLGVVAGGILVATYHLVTFACKCYGRPSTPNTTSNTRQINVQSNQQEIRPSDRNRSSSTNTRLIPMFRYSKDCNEEMCAVCLGDFKEGEQIRVLPDCLHFFHVPCIDRWLNLHSNCPLCRANTSAPEQVAVSMYLPERSNREPIDLELNVNRLSDFGV